MQLSVVDSGRQVTPRGAVEGVTLTRTDFPAPVGKVEPVAQTTLAQWPENLQRSAESSGLGCAARRCSSSSEADARLRALRKEMNSGDAAAAIEKFDKFWQQRSAASAGTLDGNLKFSADTKAKQEFAVRGLSFESLRNGDTETLSFAVGKWSRQASSITVDPTPIRDLDGCCLGSSTDADGRSRDPRCEGRAGVQCLGKGLAPGARLAGDSRRRASLPDRSVQSRSHGRGRSERSAIAVERVGSPQSGAGHRAGSAVDPQVVWRRAWRAGRGRPEHRAQRRRRWLKALIGKASPRSMPTRLSRADGAAVVATVQTVAGISKRTVSSLLAAAPGTT